MGGRKMIDRLAEKELLLAFVDAIDAAAEVQENVPLELRATVVTAVDSCTLEGYFAWKSIARPTPDAAAERLQSRLPAPFPPLYRQLILNYRYLRVELGEIALLANPPSPGLEGLEGLEEEMFRDALLSRVLVQHGFMQFARAGGGNYDPICFDIRQRTALGDMLVVRVDHEEILCFERIQVTEVIAPTFRRLLERIVGRDTEQVPS